MVREWGLRKRSSKDEGCLPRSNEVALETARSARPPREVVPTAADPLGTDGELLRDFELDPIRDYQPRSLG